MIWRWLLGIAALLATALALAWLSVSNGWFVTRQDPEDLTVRLIEHWDVYRPDAEEFGAGPYPAVVQFHGCSGARGNQAAWGAFWASNGIVGIVVDSLTPRGIDEMEARARVCSGVTLTGAERAGDVLLALDAAAALPFVDADRMVAAGWSHGGWALMDLLSMDLLTERPFNLRRLPEGGLPPLDGALLVYPHCGTLSLTGRNGWDHEVPAFFILAGKDTVIDTPACETAAAALRAQGLSVGVHVYPDADHAFDVPDIPDYIDLVHRPDLERDAKARALRWVRERTEG